MWRDKLSRLVAAVVVGASVPVAAQPCVQRWSDQFEARDMQQVRVLRTLDLGRGPELYLGGYGIDAAVPRSLIWRWDDTRNWMPMGEGPDPTNFQIWDLAVFDDGTGPALYAIGGQDVRSRLWKWVDGMWEMVTSIHGRLYSMAIFDDGSGPALYLGGEFVEIGGVNNAQLVRWRGQHHGWESVASISNATPAPARIITITIGEEAGRDVMYIGGRFTSVAGVAANHIARFDGSGWSALGDGVSPVSSASPVYAITLHDEGTGPVVYAAGNFVHAGGTRVNRVAVWDGSSWAPLGDGLNGPVWDLAFYGTPGSEVLYAGGHFTGHLARWDGQSWEVVDEGASGPVHALHVAEVRGRSVLVIGGFFAKAGPGIHPGAAMWDGEQFEGPPVDGVVGLRAHLIRPFSFENEDKLFVGGVMTGLGGREGRSHVRDSAGNWEPFEVDGKFVNTVYPFDDGTGPALFASVGRCTYLGGSTCVFIVRLRNGQWEPAATVSGLPGKGFMSFEVGGEPTLFVNAGRSVRRWTGSEWISIGSIPQWSINAMAVYDDGMGAALYVGGDFLSIDGVPAQVLARWDGTGWEEVGGGLGPGPTPSGWFSRRVWDMKVIDDSIWGGGEALYVAGNFLTAGEVESPGIVRWDGEWSSVGGGVTTERYVDVNALAWFDDGTGPALYVGGRFASASAPSFLARWDNERWEEVGALDREVNALAVTEEEDGPSLWVGGSFLTAGGHISSRIARYIGCPPCYANCDGSTTEPILTVDDFTCFIDQFAEALQLPIEEQIMHYANCDGATEPPILTVNDFTCFVDVFSAGCP